MRIVICIFCFLSAIFSFSQVVNIENKRIYNDTSGWNGNIDAGFSMIQNAKLLYTLSASSKIQYKSPDKKHYYLLVTDLKYTKSQEEIFANSGMVHLRYAYRIKMSTVKWESYYQIQYNQLLNQRLRTLLGSGLRWKFLDKNKIKLFAGSSAFAEYEEIQPNNQFNRDIRWSNYISWFIELNSNINFTGATYYQPLFRDFKDYRVMGQYALQFKITKNLRLKNEFTFFSDSKPPQGVRNTVFNTSVGLSYSFD